MIQNLEQYSISTFSIITFSKKVQCHCYTFQFINFHLSVTTTTTVIVTQFTPFSSGHSLNAAGTRSARNFTSRSAQRTLMAMATSKLQVLSRNGMPEKNEQENPAMSFLHLISGCFDDGDDDENSDPVYCDYWARKGCASRRKWSLPCVRRRRVVHKVTDATRVFSYVS